ncbi:MAG: hypothetical protein U5K72_08180 [Balneolaceae bacterium]|nr:hypothetical protein [Balneolaceae bacterium]
MKNLTSILLLIFFTTILFSEVHAQERVKSEKYVMQTDQLIRQVKNIQTYLSRETKFKKAFPDASKKIEEHSFARTSYFLKAKKAFQNDEMEVAVKSLRSAREIIKGDVGLLREVRDREVTSEILRLERELGRSVDSMLRDF